MIEPLRHLSNEAWRASSAIGLMNGKKIFCFPHMNYMRPDFEEGGYREFFKSIIGILKVSGALVLIPAKATSAVDNLCDETIDFN